MVCVKPSRYCPRLPLLAPWWNHCASIAGSSVGSLEYLASLASSTTVCGRRTPSRCSCKRTLGKVLSNSLSSVIVRSLSCRLSSKPLALHTAVPLLYPMVAPTQPGVSHPPERIAHQQQSAGYGLRRDALSPMETLAQSVSTMAPTTTPAATIPLVCALAGNGTWLAYVLATVAILLVALCIARFARHSASPGSLYTYASGILPAWMSATVAWSLLLAYVATGSSVIGGFYHYANLLLRDATGHVLSAVLLSLLVTGVSIWIAYRDVKISARLMLWIEAASVSVIVIVVALLLIRHGWHWDWDELHLHGMTGSGLRLGLVLALFSFVGFESATTLGAEARNPLKTIPRAVILSSVLAGAFFTVCAYAEVLGFHTAGQDLGTSSAPMRVLAHVAGVPVLALLIDVGALVSLFAGTLACI